MALTISQLIERTKNERNAKLSARNSFADQLRGILEEDEAGRPVNHGELSQVRHQISTLDRQIDGLSDQIREYSDEQEADGAYLRASQQTTPTRAAAVASGDSYEVRVGQTRAYDSVIRTGDTREPRIYDSATASRGTSFFADAHNWSRGGGNGGARDRLERHASEVEFHREMTERATSTGSFAGLVVPQYLVDQAALVLRNGRPMANVIQRLQIPAQGMSFTIPRGTTGASAGVQASENSAVSSTDEVWGNLSVPVVTVAGQQDVSRQSLERGTGVDQLIYTDLVKAYATAVDGQILSGTGSSGQALGIMNTGGIGAATAFGAAAGPANFNLKVAGANNAVYSAGQGLAPELLVMHPRRWSWLCGLVDSSNRPIVQSNLNVAFNTIATGGFGNKDLATVETPFVGVHNSGLPVLLDLNIPTNAGTLNEDVMLSVDADQLLLWEDGDGMPRQLSFEQTTGGSLTTKLVVYSYIAFTAGRYPAAVAKIGGVDTVAGNGLIAPTF
ncbi:phage major capsid protein [Arthrobacter sp. MI7-26]|uniref:phage major capsid protein n=1 Tax=Arthrobacter sp. MI7-26 TaxID=2993653 RepID=UPI0022497CFF|nr:phage major capsid protein [Arthrobacter sp. MI7-26]MCX2746702.1 phage major capsid protein [Arthrobacter sp. MI7-26]